MEELKKKNKNSSVVRDGGKNRIIESNCLKMISEKKKNNIKMLKQKKKKKFWE